MGMDSIVFSLESLYRVRDQHPRPAFPPLCETRPPAWLEVDPLARPAQQTWNSSLEIVDTPRRC